MTLLGLIRGQLEGIINNLTMQTINYHGWTVNTESSDKGIYRATLHPVTIYASSIDDLLDAIYERTYDLKTN